MELCLSNVFKLLQNPAILLCLVFLGSVGNMEDSPYALNIFVYTGVAAASTTTPVTASDPGSETDAYAEPDSDAESPAPAPAFAPSDSFTFDTTPEPSGAARASPGYTSPVISFASAPGMPPLSGGLPKCDGLLLMYMADYIKPIPYSGDKAAFMFQSNLNIFNVGRSTLYGWTIEIGFTHGEIIQHVYGASLPSGISLPASGNGLLFGNPSTLPYVAPAFVSGGNWTAFGHTLAIYGTEFGGNDTKLLVPTSVDIHAPGFRCNNRKLNTDSSQIILCCPSTGDLTPKSANPTPPTLISPKHKGLLVLWDVLSADDNSYQVMIRVENRQRYANISGPPGWKLQWRWRMGELIMSCDGCQTLLKGDCLTCPSCGDNKNASLAYSCDPRPQVVDGTGANGSLAAPAYNLPSSKVQFTMSLDKGKNFWGATRLDFPANFTMVIPGFACDPPQQKGVHAFPSAYGSRQMVPALASYEMNCGPKEEEVQYECCVSASAFYNTTVSLCDSCACGCLQTDTLISDGGHCDPHAGASDTTAAQVLLGNDYENATAQVGTQTGRCPSNCGVEIHLAVTGGGDDGWNLQAAISNKYKTTLKEWTAVFEFAKGMASSLNTTYSVNASFDTAPGYEDNMLVEGIKYYNSYLPGKQNVQFLMLFNRTVGSSIYNLTGGPNTQFNDHVFPKSVIFDGMQCKMPTFLPINATSSCSHMLLNRFNNHSIESYAQMLRFIIVPCILAVILMSKDSM